MQTPHSRETLLIAAREQYDRLWQVIDTLPDHGRSGSFHFKSRETNVRDVLVHLGAWQQLYLNWSQANLSDHPARFLPRPYTWHNTADLTAAILAKHHDTPFEEAADALDQTQAKIIRQVEAAIDEELFSTKTYAWTGSTSLGTYATLVTAGNYQWATRLLAHVAHQAPQHA